MKLVNTNKELYDNTSLTVSVEQCRSTSGALYLPNRYAGDERCYRNNVELIEYADTTIILMYAYHHFC